MSTYAAAVTFRNFHYLLRVEVIPTVAKEFIELKYSIGKNK